MGYHLFLKKEHRSIEDPLDTKRPPSKKYKPIAKKGGSMSPFDTFLLENRHYSEKFST
jgi:hypothetical protein